MSLAEWILASLSCLSGDPASTSTAFPEIADVSSDQVDRLFAAFAKPDSPGCALAVIQGGQIRYADGYGLANLEYDVPITPVTVFHVASVSKQFTSFAILLLADRGLLSLDDEVRKYVPELPDFGQPITIRHLMHHTSGLRDQWSLLMMSGWRLDDVITERDILDVVCRQRELNFAPGERFLYSNTGFTLLALIVQRVSGKPLRVFAEEEMFEPLGMTSTHFHDDHEMLVKNRAYSYAPNGDRGFRASVLSYANVGATSLFTTVEDLALWQQNFADHGVGGDHVIAGMLERGKLNDGRELTYAAGLEIGRYRGLATVGHSGGDAGFRAYLVRFPEQDFSVAVLANAANADPQSLAYKVADLYLADVLSQRPGPPSADHAAGAAPAAPPITLAPNVLSQWTGLYRNSITREIWTLDGADGKLSVRSPNGLFQLVPTSETRFVESLGAGTLSIEFSPGAYQRPGRARVELAANGVEQLEAVAPPEREPNLAQCAGSYWSDELEVAYRVRVQDDRLMLVRRRHADEPLRPICRDGYACDGFDAVEFTRDAKGRVDGLMLSAGRVLRLKLHKTS
jgi:CubicO group peptidase (beta-lactamase class C family)